MAIILENTPWEYAVDSGVSVKKLVFDSKHQGTIYVQVAAPNPGFNVGETVTYIKGDIYFTGRIWYIYKGSTAVNLYVKHPNPGAIAGTVGGVVHSGVVEPTLKSADQGTGSEAGAETGDQGNGTGEPGNGEGEPGIAVAGIMAKAREYKTPLLIGGGILLAYLVVKKL